MTEDAIAGAFSELVTSRADRPLVVSPCRTATVLDVDRLAHRVEQELERSGLGRGHLVVLAAANGPGFLAAFVGLRRRGCVALLIDWRTPDAERSRIARALGAAATVHCRSAWPARADAVKVSVADRSREGPGLPPIAAEVAAVKLTSGSTGAPRGILTPAEALVADDRALAVSMGLNEDERILAAVPMSHSYGLSSVVMPALMRGSVLVVPDGDGPFDTIAAAQKCDVSFLPTVPAYVGALVRMRERPPLPASLRLLITAGAPIDPEVAQRFRQAYGRGVHVFYGASECGGITLGTPVEGVEVVLGNDGTQGGEGGGLVTVASASVAAAYYPEADAHLDGERFTTSDLGSFRDGELVLLGRVDDLINVKGKKVNPREVEGVLLRLAGVEEAVVVGVPTPGGGGETVRAVVACGEGRVDREGIEAWCRTHLAAHKVPRSVVMVEEIPRNARGKVDRAALKGL